MRKSGDVLASLFLIFVGMGVIIGGSKLSIGTVREPQAGFFPFVGGVSLIVLCLILLIQGLRGRSAGIQAFGELLRPVFLILGMVVYILLFDLVGYIIATIILSIIVLRILDTKSWWVIAGVSFSLAVGTYILFDRLLSMPLPGGILERIL